MTDYTILIHPDKRLRQKATEVKQFGERLSAIVDTMFSTMYHAHGIGLAATQVNIHERIVVMDVPRISRHEQEKETDEKIPHPHDKLILINPEITEVSEELAEHEEGCLSLPGQYATVVRPAEIRVKYRDIHGEPQEREATGLLGVCIQHEIDHLNGVLFIDHLSRLKRERLEKKLAKSLKHHD
ncbi:peptide deformylase [Suttonella ornithocola]|uniref:Peptide deformylase n=1 Tax=Suttonella ornithocola TaxID=279832 RepID=A0A380MR84_9GAMM|nr:peptide deformylase [Suttonella ornithocola]SUO94566.1 Peptide deformylase [Suttonella ornithocola]